jgi:murein DD-endopeptidase MepM/ murein hydrolase activator NlpD
VIKVLLCSALLFAPRGSLAAQQADYTCPLAGSPSIRGRDTVAASGGRFDSSRGSGRKHGALDLNSSEGADVFVVRSGRAAIAASGWGVLGNTVVVDHGDGEYSVYAHLSDISVAAGAKLNAGEKLGTVGYTGNAAALRSAGLPPHLHFALIRGDSAGLADAKGPLQQLRNGADSWQPLDVRGVGPVNPASVMPSACWTERVSGNATSRMDRSASTYFGTVFL